MTPFARKVFGGLRQQFGRSPVTVGMCQAVCFDCTPVRHLIEQTASELTTLAGASGGEHGGLLFLPHQICWIELCRPEGTCGFLVDAVDDQIAFTGFSSIDAGLVMGFLELNGDGEHFVVQSDLRMPAERRAPRDVVTRAGLVVAAALLLINAPRGVERTSVLPHKGQARDLRRGGFGDLKPSQIITLSGEAAFSEGGGVGFGGRRAFHFCRSHLRMLPGGEVTRVRAHWRGDPSLGVCDNQYRVAGAPLTANPN